MALHDNNPAAFCATAGLMHSRGRKRITRLVTLPAYQGIGIGRRLLSRVAQHEHSAGFRVTITTSHPAMIACCRNSPEWKCLRVKKHGSTSQRRCYGLAVKASAGRPVVSFEFLGIGNPEEMTNAKGQMTKE